MVSALLKVMLPDFLTGSITSQLPWTVAVCAKASLFTHSTVSPTLALISVGENAIFAIVTVIVLACAESTSNEQSRTATADSRRAESWRALFQFHGYMLGMLLVALEYLEPRFEQALQLGILG